MAAIKVRVAAFTPPSRSSVFPWSKKLDASTLVKKLNRLQDYYEFTYLGTSERIGPPDLERHYSLAYLSETFHSVFADSPEYPYELMLTDVKVENDYFTQVTGHLGIVSSSDMDLAIERADKSIEEYFAYNIMETLLCLQYGGLNNLEHPTDSEDTGCLFDSCYTLRQNIVLGLQRCTICDDSRRTLDSKMVPLEQLQSVFAVLNWIKRPRTAAYAKWLVVLGLLAVGIIVGLEKEPLIGEVTVFCSGWLSGLPTSNLRFR
jgi:hypothetical protein